MKTKEKIKEIAIPPMVRKEVTVPIRGKTPLLMDRFTEEAKNSILAKQTGLAKSGAKKLRDTKKEILGAIHRTSQGQIAFPAAGFKKGMMTCVTLVGDKKFTKKLVMGLQIVKTQEGLVPLKYKKQNVLEHTIGHTTKFTPQFHDWSCELAIEYDANNISAQDIVTLLNYAGFYVGIGAWRPNCRDGGTGNFGMYEVASKAKKAK